MPSNLRIGIYNSVLLP